MVKITYSPINEVVIHEVIKVDRDDLLRGRITPAGNMPLYWCNGILFTFNSMPMTKDLVKDYLKGVIHWMEVHYSEMKNYEPIVELNDEQYKAIMRIRVIDTSMSTLHVDAIKWLKGRR
ncbi:MAG: hypothetical protein ACHQX1_03160 [Candidatus Micrarchaeales archaeon]